MLLGLSSLLLALLGLSRWPLLAACSLLIGLRRFWLLGLSRSRLLTLPLRLLGAIAGLLLLGIAL